MYPGVYAAKSVQVRPDGRITAYVPQLFGDTIIVIGSFTGTTPPGGTMGWVVFQSGDPEFPVWISGTATTVVEGDGEIIVSTEEPEFPSEGTMWINPDDDCAVGSINLNAINDVSVPSPSIGDRLEWDGTEWVAASTFTQSGSQGLTFDGSGQATLTFPEPFASPPTSVVGTVRTGTDQWLTYLSETSADVVLVLHDPNGTVSTTRTVSWAATGERA